MTKQTKDTIFSCLIISIISIWATYLLVSDYSAYTETNKYRSVKVDMKDTLLAIQACSRHNQTAVEYTKSGYVICTNNIKTTYKHVED